ncbi:MAG: hypothetical protein IK001_01810 [Lachnospiraceae bacterium]|nr:hypothetical protein [Lachnospiraceae bacterium]
MYECPNCAANLRFSIEKQKLWCEACGTELSPYEVKKDRDAEERQDFEVTIFTCPQCGGEIISEDTEAAAFCSFCGGSTILDSRISSARRPAYIIPFTRTKADCAAAYKKLVKRSLFMPSELMSTQNIDSFRGIYIPYWMYETQLEGHVSADVASKHSTYKGNYEYVKHYRYETDVKTQYKGMTYDASGAFSDNLSNAIAPYDTTQVQPFTPSYLSGFYADTTDVAWDTYSEDVEDLVAEDCTERLMKDPALSDYTVEADKLKPQLTPTVDNKVLTMMPVWFMSIRHKEHGKEDRISYVAVNGQTGEAAGDLPISLGKYLIASAILAAAIFALMFFTVSLNRFSSLIMTCVLLIVMAITYYSQENKIKKWETGEEDKGLKAAKILTPAKNFDPMTGKRIKTKYMPSGFDKAKIILGIGMTVLLVMIEPNNDWILYAASIIQMLFIFDFINKLMHRYNLLTTRRLPQFNRTGGDDSAKEAHKAGLD